MLKDYCEEQNLFRKTIDAVKKHYTFWYQECSPFHHETALLSDLPNSIRKEAILYIHRDAVERIGLFAAGTMPDWFVASIIRRLDPQGFLPGEPIIGTEEAHMAQEIFFMFDGVALAYPAHDYDPETEEEPEDMYYPGSIFGIDSILEPDKPYFCTVICSKEGPCCVYVLRQMVLSDISISQPELGHMLQDALCEALVEQRLQRDKSKPATELQSGDSTPNAGKRQVVPNEKKGPDIFVSQVSQENIEAVQEPHPLAPSYSGNYNDQSADSSQTNNTPSNNDAFLDSGLRAAAISEQGAEDNPTPPADVEVSPSPSPHGLPPPPEASSADPSSSIQIDAEKPAPDGNIKDNKDVKSPEPPPSDKRSPKDPDKPPDTPHTPLRLD